MPHGRLPQRRTPYPHFVVTIGEQDLRRSPQMNIEPWQDEGARVDEAQGSYAGTPGGHANGGT